MVHPSTRAAIAAIATLSAAGGWLISHPYPSIGADDPPAADSPAAIAPDAPPVAPAPDRAAPADGADLSFLSSYFPLVLKRQSHRDVFQRVALPGVGACTLERWQWRGAEKTSVNDVDVDGRGTTWFATSIGAVGWAADGGWLHVGQVDGLADDDALTVGVDREGHPWFGTRFYSSEWFRGRLDRWQNGGLSGLIDPDANPLFFGILTWRNTGDAASGVLGPVHDIAADSHGGLWIATGLAFQGDTIIRGGLYRLDPDRRWEYFPGTLDRPTEAVSELAVDAEGGVWMDTGSGIALRRADGTWPRVLEGGRDLAEMYTPAVTAAGDAVWMAGTDGKLHRRGIRGDWLSVVLPPDERGERRILPHTMAVDMRGNLWIASETYAGVRWANGTLQFFAKGDPLGGGYIQRIWRDRVGELWMDHFSEAFGSGLTRVRCR